MKEVPDNLHGFGTRPHYEAFELDSMFERLVTAYLRKKYAKVEFPIKTDDITSLIEENVSDLDLYSNLTGYGEGVEGMTEFQRNGKKPIVRISETVHKFENRLRTTLTHEYGHVVLHGYLFAMRERQSTARPNQRSDAIYCYRDNMLPIRKSDWMEWQAGYASGAALMPKTAVAAAANALQAKNEISGAIQADSVNGREMVATVVDRFQVSRDAAIVRLKVLNFLI